MKIKGRFIAILASLSLLLAVLAVVPVAAGQGDIDLDDTAYTAVGGKNIVTITVDDGDLNEPRVGTARFTLTADAGNSTPFSLDGSANTPISAAVLEGEIEKTETFSGAVLATGTDDSGAAAQATLVDSTADFVVTSGAAVGDILTNITDSSSGPITGITATSITATLTGGAQNLWDNGDSYSIADATFALSMVPRDADGDGMLDDGINITHDVQVEVEGSDLGVGDYTVTYGVLGTSAPQVDILIGGISPPGDGDDIEVTYQISEYDQTNAGNTPIRLFGSFVKFGGSFDNANSSKSIDSIDNANGDIRTNSDVDFSGGNTSVVIEFIYDLIDTSDFDDGGVLRQTINLKSTSDSSGIDLTAIEKDESDDDFIVQAVLIDRDNLDTINSAIARDDSLAETDVQLVALADANTIQDLLVKFDHLITENNSEIANNLDAETDAALIADLKDEIEVWKDAQTWVTDTVAALAGVDANSALVELIGVTLEVAHEDTFTASYDDQSDDRDTDTASIDLEPPVVSGLSPGDGDFTNDETPLLTATVIDVDEGLDVVNILDDARITITVNNSPVTDDVSIDAIVDGFEMEYVATAAKVDEGDNVWMLIVEDSLGNKNTVKVDFVIDTIEPDIEAVETGIGLEIDDDTNEFTEFADSGWIKVTFDEAIDPDSVQASDFDVSGSSEPDEAMTSEGDDIFAAAGDPVPYPEARLFVYLMVDDLDADDTPTVEVVDDIDDLAGNDLDDAEEEADDKIGPTLTVNVSDDLGADEEEIQITVTSDENLALTTVKLVVTNEELSTDKKVSLTKGEGNLWTGTFEIDASTEYTAKANAQDKAGNAAKEADEIFEGDIHAPGEFPLTTNVVEANTVDITDIAIDPEVEAGAVWIITTFGETEYTKGEDGDTHKKVTVTAISLEDEDGNVLADVPDRDLFTDDGKSFTLAIDLVPGDYTFSISAMDDAGNEVEVNELDFKVIDREPFEIDLRPGVNLVSLPDTPVGDGGDINLLFEGLPVTAVTTYDRAMDMAGQNPWMSSVRDAETGLFTGVISFLEPGKAYFVVASAGTTVEVDINPANLALPPVIQVLRGFNAIGFWSVEGTLNEATVADPDSYFGGISWSVAYSFDPTPGIGWEVIRPDGDLSDDLGGAGQPLKAGMGYLVFVTQDGTVTP